jgi:hypothetical protein
VPPVAELLVKVSCPDADPVARGTNCICRVTDWFGFNVNGRLTAELLEPVKPVPLRVIALIVTGAVPDEVSVNGSVVVEFTLTFPKESKFVLTVSLELVVTVPVPLSWTCVVPPVAELLVKVSCPDADPVARGTNCICRVTDWFGFNVNGRLTAESLVPVKPVPLRVAALIVTGAVPDEVSVNGSVDATLRGTLPKSNAIGLAVSWGVVLAVPDPPDDTVVRPEGTSLITVRAAASRPSVAPE